MKSPIWKIGFHIKRLPHLRQPFYQLPLYQINLLHGSPILSGDAESFFEKSRQIAVLFFHCIVEGEQKFLIDAEEITEGLVSERTVSGGFFLDAVTEVMDFFAQAFSGVHVVGEDLFAGNPKGFLNEDRTDSCAVFSHGAVPQNRLVVRLPQDSQEFRIACKLGFARCHGTVEPAHICAGLLWLEEQAGNDTDVGFRFAGDAGGERVYEGNMIISGIRNVPVRLSGFLTGCPEICDHTEETGEIIEVVVGDRSQVAAANQASASDGASALRGHSAQIPDVG